MAQSSRRALIIGNTEYRELPHLIMPRADVQEMASVLGNPDIRGFEVKLFNEKSNSLHHEIQKFLRRLKPDDTALLYFSGHGVLNDYDELFLATPDTQKEFLETTSVSLDNVLKHLDRSRSDRQILVLDCCFSGTATRAIGAKGEWALSAEKLGKGTEILAASGAWQRAQQTLVSDKLEENALSVFTYYLVEGLKTGAAAKTKNLILSRHAGS